METKILPASMEYLDEVLSFIEKILEAGGFDEKAIRLVTISSEELFTNIASYAYEEEGTGKVEISCELTKEKAVIRLKDWGTPYDPLTHEDPDITASIEDREIGGLGIFMVKKFMDDVRYERVDGCNVIEIQKMVSSLESKK